MPPTTANLKTPPKSRTGKIQKAVEGDGDDYEKWEIYL